MVVALVFAAAAPALTASPTPKPSCNSEARAVYIPAPQYPRGYYLKSPVTVTLKLQIAEDGTIDGGGVVQSSGIAAFDGAAVDAAEHAQFAPKMVNCRPVGGTYLFRVTFNPH